ncbi:MAG: phosphodiesterase [Acidimicrobiales bacterium]
MLIAQITDLHVDEDSGFMRRFVDGNAKLSAALAFLAARRHPPDVILATGDLVNDGRSEQYRLLRDLLAPCTIPLYLVPGNHDDREEFRAAFADQAWMPDRGPIDYVIDEYPVRLVGLDTSEADRHDGYLDADQLAWLEHVLAQEPQRPTLVFLHHPPFLTGMWMFDEIRLNGAEALHEVVGRHPQVVHILAGHVHRPVSTTWGTTSLTTAPSTAHQSRFDLLPDEGAGIVDETPMIQFHLWDGASVVTHSVPFEAPAKTIEISEVVGDWPAARDRILAGPPFPKGPGGLF